MVFFSKTFHFLSGISLVKKVLVIFSVLLLAVLIIERPGLGRKRNFPLLFPTLISSEANRIDFERLSGTSPTLSLRNEEGRWKIVNGSTFPADEDRVNRLLSVIEDLDRENTVSVNPDRVSLFGLDEASAPRIQVFGKRDRKTADLLVGSPSPNGIYAKKTGAKETIMAPLELLSFVAGDIDSWKDKTLIRVDEKQARRIVLAQGKEETILEKRDGRWKTVSPVEGLADELSVRTLFERLSDLKADSFASSLEGSQANFDSPDYKVSVRMSDDSLKIAVFKSKGDGQNYYAKDGDRNLIYLLSETKVKDLFGLRFEPAPSETPDSSAKPQ